MKEIEKIDCPLCGKTLVCLSDDECKDDGLFYFWCDECNIDIRIEVN